MRAAAGAIEHLRLVDDRVEYQTIAGAPPVGLCGSGILDALAQLYHHGVVDATGKMGQHARIRTHDGQRDSSSSAQRNATATRHSASPSVTCVNCS